jgi:hypothetical protein
MPIAFEKLLVYRKAIDLFDAVCQQTEQFPAFVVWPMPALYYRCDLVG